jgi:23S rRNA (guanosine2251-2'-O)-methyltransferase
VLQLSNSGKNDNIRIYYSNRMKYPVHLLLHDIRSVHNAGSIFRTADAAGISKIMLSGFTPTPVDRFNHPRSDFAKIALGAEKTIVWEYAKTFLSVVKKYKKLSFQIIALEQASNSVDYKKVKINKPSLIILGNEPKGISTSLLKYADIIAEIPMKGEKESLNVSVAAGIFLFKILNI